MERVWVLFAEWWRVESEWTARDRELKTFGGPARTFLRPGSAQKRDASLGQQADHPTTSRADGVAVEAVMVADVFSKLLA